MRCRKGNASGAETEEGEGAKDGRAVCLSVVRGSACMGTLILEVETNLV